MDRNIATLFRKLAILATPLMVLLTLYFVLDPFHVMRRFEEPVVFHGVFPNREVTSTEFLLQREAPSLDAFVFGNSRSQAFHCRDWLKWIGPAKPFHYDALRDSLFGLRGKMRLLERKKFRVRHALVILDKELLKGTTDSTDIVSIKHPAVSGGTGLFFQAVFLKAFFSDLFPLKYLDYRLFGTFRPYMVGAIAFDEGAVSGDRDTFDVFYRQAEKEIASQPDRYFASRGRGVDRTPRDAVAVIDGLRLSMLQEIQASFVRQGTGYQIVVSPDFARVRLNPADVTALNTVFGAERVHDFSRDASLGLDIHDWYDIDHYRPTLARRMLSRIYGDLDVDKGLAR